MGGVDDEEYARECYALVEQLELKNLIFTGRVNVVEYMQKLDHFIISRTEGVKRLNNQYQLKGFYDAAAKYYKKPVSSNRTSRKKEN